MAYYSPTGAPVQQTRGTSPSIRNEFALIAAGFAQLPVPAAIAAGYANYAGLDTGAANAYVVTLSPTIIVAYTDGMVIRFKAANANTAASTVNLNALGVVGLLQPDGSALPSGLIKQNDIVSATYNSTYSAFLVGANLYAYVAAAAASAGAAAVSAAAAAQSATNAQTTYLNFQTVYLGSKTTDPTLDNQGNALITGALYYNSVSMTMKTWTGSAWVQAFVPASNYVAKTGDTMTGALNDAPPVSIAASATVNIGAAASNNVTITGSGGPITAFDTIAAGAIRVLTFTGTPTLTQNATSLILPGAANIPAAAGDVAFFVSLGAGNWKCIVYQKTDGTTVAGGPKAFGTVGTAVVANAVAATAGFYTSCTFIGSARNLGVAYGASSFPLAILRDANGATLATQQIEAVAIGAGFFPCLVPLTATTAALGWLDTSQNFKAVILTDNTSSIGVGTIRTLTVTGTPSAITVVPFSATKLGLMYANSAGNLRYNVAAVAGAAITPGTDSALLATGTLTGCMRSAAISATQAVLIGCTGGANNLTGVALTEASGVITAGAGALASVLTASAASNGAGGDIIYVSGSRCLVTNGLNTIAGAHAFTVDLVGTGSTARLYANTPIPLAATGGANRRLGRVSAGTYVDATLTPGSSYQVLTALSVSGPDVAEIAGIGGINFAPNTNELCIAGTNALTFYSDSLNSGFPTTRPIALNTVT